MSIGGYYSARCYNTIAFYHTAVHHYAAHSYQYIVFYGAAVYYSIMPYRYIVTYSSRVCLVGSVDNDSILNISIVAYANAINVAAYYSVVPYGAMVA